MNETEISMAKPMGRLKISAYAMDKSKVVVEASCPDPSYSESKVSIVHSFLLDKKDIEGFLRTVEPIPKESESLDSLLEQAKKESQEKRRRENQWTLGELIDELSAVKNINDDGCKVWFDFGPPPGEMMSWRGSYEELSIDWGKNSYEGVQLADFIKTLKDAVGETFQGYKGGDYKMDRDTPLWVAEYGSATHCGICGIEPLGKQNIWEIIIHTKYVDY